jgi:signal recognition particle receptor subunit beta
MAVFDRQEQKIVVRVVYDGPANAGKTTNLAQLCRFFTTLRRSELVAPGERAGRTLFFDWLQLDGGLVGGYALRCQLVTVPGQGVLSHRRRHLLRKADSVVFVCDSTASGVEIGRRMLDGLERHLGPAGAPRLPMVVQANKQDLPGCLNAQAVAASLGVEAGTPVVAARAHDGIGVRETVVLAIRAAANAVQRELLERGTSVFAGDAESSDALYGKMLQEEEQNKQQSVSRVSIVLSSLPASADSDNGGLLRETPLSPEPRVVVDAMRSVDAPPLQSMPAVDEQEPPLPTPDVPTGSVWPATLGREILRSLAGCTAIHRGDLVGRHGTSDGSGTSDALIYAMGKWCLKTSRRRRFASVDEGRQALLQLARRKTLLGDLLAPSTVLCLQPDANGALWLWTLSPWLKTLRAWMVEADSRGEEASLELALCSFARAAIDALALAARAGLVLDVHPSNFATVDGHVAYVDDDIAVGRVIPAIGHAVLRRVEEYGRWTGATEAYVRFLESSLHSSLAQEEVARLGLRQILAETLVLSEAGRDARNRLVAVLKEGQA